MAGRRWSPPPDFAWPPSFSFLLCVDPVDGDDDSADGTKEHPFLTSDRAEALVWERYKADSFSFPSGGDWDVCEPVVHVRCQ